MNVPRSVNPFFDQQAHNEIIPTRGGHMQRRYTIQDRDDGLSVGECIFDETYVTICCC